jgi:hypothetical protein
MDIPIGRFAVVADPAGASSPPRTCPPAPSGASTGPSASPTEWQDSEQAYRELVEGGS